MPQGDIQRDTERERNLKMLALLACQCYGLAWGKYRHTVRVKFEILGIVGMPVLWLGMG